MISWREVTRYVRFADHGNVEDYCRLGWCITDALEGTNHAAYSVLCAWICRCKPVEPLERARARQAKKEWP